ncbi:MAG: AAA family ATPase [Chloroflexota bacterium]|nr:AAA family ATPase [Chloroflexota bacterium]MDE2959722.1 AAA family ATPase [Chloroflexota bacterium]
MTLTKVKLEGFTAFADLEVRFSPGINALIGENGTGKTHLMKVCYAACDVAKTGENFADKLVRVFLPSGRVLGRMTRRRQGTSRGAATVYRDDRSLRTAFSNRAKVPGNVRAEGIERWMDDSLESVYIPVKDMLANAPGFNALYARREIHFEEIYADILERAYLPALRGPSDRARRSLRTALQKAIDGRATVRNGEFFLSNKQGNLEFALLAEGMRKLGLLWLLIQNGTLQSGSVLFWDEPETNLNPKMYGIVMNVLLELQRAGVQVFFATHDYVILKELDLQMTEEDAVAFHSLYRDEDGEIACYTSHGYLDIRPNAISDTFTSLYDREIERSFGGRLR